MVRKRLNKDERRIQIQQIAMKEFKEKGYKNTSMNDIIKATGLSAGGLYHYYGSKSEIMYDLMVLGCEYREGEIEKYLKLKGETITSDMFAEVMVEKMLDYNELTPLYVMLLQEIKDDELLREIYERLKLDSIKSLRELIAAHGYNPPTQEEFEFIADITNSIMLGCEILCDREVFKRNRDNLILMMKTYFAKIELR